MADTGTGDRAHIADPGTSDATAGRSEEAAPQQVRSVLVLGANGPWGRRTVQQALERGLGVGALTRRPETFPITLDQLDEDRSFRRVLAVTTPGLRVHPLQTIRRELLER